MSEKGRQKVQEAAKETIKGEDDKSKTDESPGPLPMGGGDSEVNEAAGSKVKAERDN